jgi:hypothetical protein
MPLYPDGHTTNRHLRAPKSAAGVSVKPIFDTMKLQFLMHTELALSARPPMILTGARARVERRSARSL